MKSIKDFYQKFLNISFNKIFIISLILIIINLLILWVWIYYISYNKNFKNIKLFIDKVADLVTELEENTRSCGKNCYSKVKVFYDDYEKEKNSFSGVDVTNPLISFLIYIIYFIFYLIFDSYFGFSNKDGGRIQLFNFVNFIFTFTLIIYINKVEYIKKLISLLNDKVINNLSDVLKAEEGKTEPTFGEKENKKLLDELKLLIIPGTPSGLVNCESKEDNYYNACQSLDLHDKYFNPIKKMIDFYNKYPMHISPPFLVISLFILLKIPLILYFYIYKQKKKKINSCRPINTGGNGRYIGGKKLLRKSKK